MAQVSFRLNGEALTVSNCSTHTTLLSWLRHSGRTGTKEGCAEGDCGACTIVMRDEGPNGPIYRSINSCIALLVSMHGKEVLTVEGLAQAGVLHPVQEAMVACSGSQCGYCTPGFVMSMFEGYYRADLDSPEKIVDQLNGNLCRCTGYRPIRDAMTQALNVKKSSAGEDLFDLRARAAVTTPISMAYAHHNVTTASREQYFQPGTLKELLELKAAHPLAELLAGATEIGVYINKRSARYDVLIGIDGVSELRSFRETETAWLVGGGVTLTELDETLGEQVPVIRKMLWAFASRPVRNRATIAGNLVTASPIGDLAPVLLSFDAEVIACSLLGERRIALADFFTGYRKTVLRADEILLRIEVPKRAALAMPASSGTVFREYYKVSKRRELDISIVAASFRIELDASGTVTLARLCYGGVAATPARALAAEAYLVGKPWTRETVTGACNVLALEFTPLNDVRAGARFRSQAVQSLLEKLFDGVQSEAQDIPFTYEASAPWAEHDLSRALLHESARGHVTGSAKYVDDAVRGKQMLDAWPVMSPHAHARVLTFDTSEALKVPGVVSVLTAKDVPGMNDVGAVRHDEPLFATDEVQFAGQMLAVVLGTSLEACRLGAARVKATYEVLPAILDLREAVERASFHSAGHRIARGDAVTAIADAPQRLSGELLVGGQEHFYLESQAAWAEATDDGGVLVASSTQHPSEVQAIVSHVLALARNMVVVEAPRMGGGFGGKETQGAAFAAVCALGAVQTGKPVRMQLDRDVDMVMTGKRHPFLFRYEVGFDAQGSILGLKVDVFNDGGYALDLSESICDRALFHLDNAYYLPAVSFFGRVAKTNMVSHTAFRGFGGPQGMVCIEQIMDRIARTLGFAPEDVRMRNLYRPSEGRGTTPYGQVLEGDRSVRVFTELRAASEFDARKKAIALFNEGPSRIKRGIAITPVKFGISFTATFLNQAGALVQVYRDGTVQVNHGGTEMGQGLHTKLLGIAMRELGIPRTSVRMMKTQTDKVPNTSATAASAGSDLNGQAVKAACEEIRMRLTPIAQAMFAKAGAAPDAAVTFENGRVTSMHTASASFSEVVEAAYFAQVSLSATGFYRTPGIGYDKAKGEGKPFYYFAYGAAVSEVEVDGYSGMKRVRRVDILHDVGDSLNPGVDRGQIEGAFVQGMGWLTAEELKWDAKGHLASHSASTYQIPSIGDVPPDFRVKLLTAATQPGVIHGSKAVGEPPLMLAISVREALREAVAAFGPNALTDLPSPLTHEVLFHAASHGRV
jgi:xanthine dehydrogenase molybdopterin binding subunit/xanthine dehydrogenase small subunit